MKGQSLGLQAEATLRRDDLLTQLEESLGGPVRCIAAGPMETKRIGIVTGGAGGEIYAAARAGVDTYITGEAPHWAAVAAEELGINLFLGGHYATETFGVKALAAKLSRQFDRAVGISRSLRPVCESSSLGRARRCSPDFM